MLDIAGGAVRPAVRFLHSDLIARIFAEARDLLADPGIRIENERVSAVLLDAGAAADAAGRVRMRADLVDRALRTVPRSFTLHDRDGAPCATLGSGRTHFTPGSSAVHLLDADTGQARLPLTADYVRYARLVDRLDAIDYGSTAFIPSDVPESVSDAYRLYLSLIHSRKPVVTGAFSVAGLPLMARLLEAVRGDGRALAERPLAVFSCCPLSPLRWSEDASQNLVDCARLGIPVEIVSMPLTGLTAPGTLVGTLVGHAAEVLSGVVMSQVAAPGAPVLWGGSTAVFDYRYETTPMGAIETQMLACAAAEIGRSLGLPTQGYVGLSDAAALDAQAGLETASGMMLAVLAGIDSVSGAGMLDFENCQSLEKLVVDAEICAMARRMAEGITPRDGDFPTRPHYEELLREGHLLIAPHTRRHFRHDVRFPSPLIRRAARPRFEEEGAPPLSERARHQVDALIGKAPAAAIDDDRRRHLEDLMSSAARAAGLERLPHA